VTRIKCTGRNNLNYNSCEKLIYIGLFFDLVIALFAVFFSLWNRGGKLIFGDGSDDPLQASLEDVLGQREVKSDELEQGGSS
jgi:hypothetical protein